MLRTILQLLFSAALLTACNKSGDTIGTTNTSSSSNIDVSNSYWEGTWVNAAGEIVGYVRILYGDVADGGQSNLNSVSRVTSDGICILQDNQTADVNGASVQIDILGEVRLQIHYTSNSLGEGFVYTSSGSCIVESGTLELQRSVLVTEDEFSLLLFPNQARMSTTTVGADGAVVHEELEPAQDQGIRRR